MIITGSLCFLSFRPIRPASWTPMVPRVALQRRLAMRPARVPSWPRACRALGSCRVWVAPRVRTIHQGCCCLVPLVRPVLSSPRVQSPTAYRWCRWRLAIPGRPAPSLLLLLLPLLSSRKLNQNCRRAAIFVSVVLLLLLSQSQLTGSRLTKWAGAFRN